MTITLKCRKGHKVEVHTPAEAERLNLTACNVCFKPLFVSSIRRSIGERGKA